ncbi:hypothetical protein NONO_c73800 [Nocardia nova SH22a]|uniref:Threonyl-tRNA synthetase editing domain-containing protein n=1 Tax=Nocardia nova SH22a TaxID=1415166 RepID=W5TRX1_9NOCA|nr:threonyl-tRNA synthetase editing domain-containing protein [Nocardia nova]AHH22135.1 hypothetical protein NONO_c73800 [Nocardia nova SH22a]
MRILSSRCRKFVYTVTTPSPAAVDLDPLSIGTVNRFDECLFLMVGAEREDVRLGSRPVKVIRRTMTKTAAQCVVINGFSHLAHPCDRPHAETALDVLQTLTAALQGRGISVHLMPFGWNKRWTAEVLDGEWEQRVDYLTPSPLSSQHAAGPTSPMRHHAPI